MEIGLTLTEEKVVILETATHIQIGRGANIAKQDLVDRLGCGPGDKCWSVTLSSKPWPWKLQLCIHKDDPGHESWDSDKHTFTASEVTKLRAFTDNLAAPAANRE